MATVREERASLEENSEKILATVERICRSKIDSDCKLLAIHILTWPGSEATGVSKDVMNVLNNPDSGTSGKLMELHEGLIVLCKR